MRGKEIVEKDNTLCHHCINENCWSYLFFPKKPFFCLLGCLLYAFLAIGNSSSLFVDGKD